MEKYKISKNIRINGIDETSFEYTPSQYRQGYFILDHAVQKRSYLINETVHYFINKFSEPKTQSEVVQEIQAEIKSNGEEIEETCSAFFQFLCKRKILVTQNKEEFSIEFKPLYKEGDSINNWIILDVLSNKKSVDIYTALNKATGVTCVIKLLNKDKIGETEVYEKEALRLEREYSLLQKARGIAAISQAFAFEKDEHQNAYIVLEYISGKGLSRYLNSREAVPFHECLQIMENMLNGFSGLHQNSLIHGDIHPSNVMVNEDKTVRIIDLGLSRDADTDKNEVLKFGGVNYYMPPERINVTSVKKFSKEPDLYSDVYQIGLLLYLILYNTVPFNGFIWEELAQNIKEGTDSYPELTFWNEPVPASLINLVKKSIHKEPLERYADATKILKDFKKACLQKISP